MMDSAVNPGVEHLEEVSVHSPAVSFKGKADLNVSEATPKLYEQPAAPLCNILLLQHLPGDMRNNVFPLSCTADVRADILQVRTSVRLPFGLVRLPLGLVRCSSLIESNESGVPAIDRIT